MSGFLKRETRTVNPAGGVNPASSPNVGQYGWTSFDAGNVNQIIEYVNICKEYADRSKDSADYVASRFGELESFMFYIERIYDQIGPIFSNIEIIYTNITRIHSEVSSMHVDVLAAKDLVLASEAITIAKTELAIESANAAKISETSAAASAKDAADTAEELRKGQVYRGTWNLQANNSYPTEPDTNSVWDIVLNEGSIEFMFDNKRWFWGDRLLYLKDDKAFTQIESGSTVVSVNGKSGAVTLVPDDIGAVSNTGGLINGGLDMRGQITFGDSHKGINYSENDLSIVANEGTVNIRSKHNPKAFIDGNEQILYHTGYRPTPSDIGAHPNTWIPTAGQVGALSLTGGTLTKDGACVRLNAPTAGASNYLLGQVAGVNNWYVGKGSSVSDDVILLSYPHSSSVRIQSDKVVANKDLYVNTSKVYHEGFKPTLSDIGAAPGGYGLGEIVAPAMHDRAGFFSYRGVEPEVPANGAGWQSCYTASRRAQFFIGASNGKAYSRFSQSDVVADESTPWAEHYTTHNKPTTTDIGALPITGGRIVGNLELTGGLVTQSGVTINGTGNVQAMTGGFLRCNTESVMSLDGKEYGFVTSKRDVHLCNNAYWNGRDWLKYEDSVESHYIVAKQGGLEHMWSNAGSANPNQHRGKVLSSHNTGYVAASSVLVPEVGNGWIVNDHELLVYQFPGGVHVKGILRRNPGVGKVNDVIVYLHANAKLPYSIFHLDKSTTTAPFGWSYFESLNFNTNAISSGGWNAETGWIMVDFMVQFQ